MDAARFDTLAKTFTSHPSRRTTLRLLAGSALAAGLARLGLAEAKQGRKKKNKKKRKKKAPPCGSAGARFCKGGKCTAEHTICLGGSCWCGLTSLPRACGGQCISARDCCVDGQPLRHGQTYRDCGVCTFGTVIPGKPCGTITNTGCRTCNEATFRCEPTNNGQPCGTGTGTECCQGRCLPACPAGQGRNVETCECNPCPGAAGVGRVQAAAACCADGRPFCQGEGRCCSPGENCINGRCCPETWFRCQGNAPACCPNGTKCCPGLNYCCDRARGCHCPDDDNVCEEQLCP